MRPVVAARKVIQDKLLHLSVFRRGQARRPNRKNFVSQ
jgi:hypothetical protein